MQTSPKGTYNGMLHCAGGILKNEGPLAFYKGTLTPLLGIGVCVSIQFGVIEYMKRFFAERNVAHGVGGTGGHNLNGNQLVIAGVLAGLGNGFVSGPVEHIRIRTFLSLSLSTLCSLLSCKRSTNPAIGQSTLRGPFRCHKKDRFGPRYRWHIQRSGCNFSS